MQNYKKILLITIFCIYPFSFIKADPGPITVSVEDLTLSNVVGGDDIDRIMTITRTYDQAYTLTCSLDTSILTMDEVLGNDEFTLTATIVNTTTCNQLKITGIIPTDVTNGADYSGSVVVTLDYVL